MNKFKISHHLSRIASSFGQKTIVSSAYWCNIESIDLDHLPQWWKERESGSPCLNLLVARILPLGLPLIMMEKFVLVRQSLIHPLQTLSKPLNSRIASRNSRLTLLYAFSRSDLSKRPLFCCLCTFLLSQLQWGLDQESNLQFLNKRCTNFQWPLNWKFKSY